MKGQFWGKKEDGSFGFILKPIKKPSPAEAAQNIIAAIEKAKPHARPNHVSNYIPEPVKEEKPFIPVEDPHFDPNDPCWLYMVIIIHAEIMKLRILNDDERLTEKATAGIRGEIKRLKKMLNLPARIAKGDEKHLQI